MDNANGLTVTVLTMLGGAIGWLAKKLYDAPRQAELDRINADCDELRKIVNNAADSARTNLAEREAENRALRDEIAALKATVERRTGQAAER